MKAKLIKTPEQLYKLKFYNDEDMLACATALLSKKNCDEIFGVVDVEKLADEAFPDESEPGWRDSFSPRERKGFKSGFNKAMELYQPKEIDVEIETTMRPVWGDESSMRATYVKKLDSEGCLILTKKI
jgi:hypothetical protein